MNMSCGTRPSWADICSLETPSNECLSIVQSLLSCPTEITVARSFQGGEAQRLIDFLDRVSKPCYPRCNYPTHCVQVLTRLCLDKKLWKRCLRLLSKICKAHKIIPASYILQRELIRVGRIRCHGGSADVSDGEYLGGLVAIKRLKVNEGPDLKGTFRVCTTLKPPLWFPTLNFHPAFMPRDHLLETFIPSQHSSFIGCFAVRRPTLFLRPLRVDAQRKCDAIHEIKSCGKPFATGKSLSHHHSPRLPSTQLSEVMAGVAYLHNLGIVHGDLKGVSLTSSTYIPLLTS